MQVIELLKQMAYVIPSMIIGSQTITAAIHGAFKIEKKNIVHAISWIVSVLVGVGFVAFNGLDFGLGTAWNYVLGSVCGLLMVRLAKACCYLRCNYETIRWETKLNYN